MSMPRIEDATAFGPASPLSMYLAEMIDDYMKAELDTTWEDVLRALEQMRHTLTERLVHDFQRERG